MEIWHITLTAERRSRLPVFRDEGAYLTALHLLGRIGAGALALFGLLAEHLHLIAPVPRVVAGRLAQRVSLSVRRTLGIPLAPSDFTAVESRSHMRWLLRYMLEQPIKHRMPGHPALWVGSCLPELLGARVVAGLSLRIREVLPDFHEGRALDLLGLGPEPLALPDRERLLGLGARGLVRAAAAASALPDRMGGATAAARTARRAVIQLGRRVGFGTRELVAALEVCSKTVWRLGCAPVDDRVLGAIARRVALEDRVARQGAG